MKFSTLASGSSGNAAVLMDDAGHILIDIGISNRAVCERLESLGVSDKDVSAIFITHEHSDHVRGLSVWAKKHPNCEIFASHGTFAQMHECEVKINLFNAGECFDLNGFHVKPFKTPHDANDSVAYLFERDGSRMMIATDLGYVTDELRENMKNLDFLLIEANYDKRKLEYGRYPRPLKERIASEIGHLSNDACAECVLYAVQNGCKNIALGHLSEENNSPRIAYDTVHRKLLDAGIIPGVDMNLTVAPRGNVMPPIEVGKGAACVK